MQRLTKALEETHLPSPIITCGTRFSQTPLPSPTFDMMMQRLWQGHGFYSFTTAFAKPLPSLLSEKPCPKPHLCHRHSIPINPFDKPTFAKPHLYHLIIMHSFAINGKGDNAISNSRAILNPNFQAFFTNAYWVEQLCGTRWNKEQVFLAFPCSSGTNFSTGTKPVSVEQVSKGQNLQQVVKI